jgi:hypothetical protein
MLYYLFSKQLLLCLWRTQFFPSFVEMESSTRTTATARMMATSVVEIKDNKDDANNEDDGNILGGESS